MANWLDKITQAANRVADAAQEATSSTIDKYKKDGLDGILKSTQDVVSKGLDNTQAYLKDIGTSAKQTMKESEKNVGEGTLSGKIASGISAVIHTTKIVSEDLTNASQKLLNNLTRDENAIDKVGNLDGVGRKVDNGEDKAAREAKLDSIALETVLRDVIKARQVQDTEWITEQNRRISVMGLSWFDNQSRQGDKGAISLLEFHLAQMLELDYQQYRNKQGELRREAIKILEQMQDEKRQVARAENEGMTVTPTTTSRKSSASAKVRVPTKVTQTQDVEKEAKKPVAKKVAKKTTVNKTDGAKATRKKAVTIKVDEREMNDGFTPPKVAPAKRVKKS